MPFVAFFIHDTTDEETGLQWVVPETIKRAPEPAHMRPASVAPSPAACPDTDCVLEVTGLTQANTAKLHAIFTHFGMSQNWPALRRPGCATLQPLRERSNPDVPTKHL